MDLNNHCNLKHQTWPFRPKCPMSLYLTWIQWHMCTCVLGMYFCETWTKHVFDTVNFVSRPTHSVSWKQESVLTEKGLRVYKLCFLPHSFTFASESQALRVVFFASEQHLKVFQGIASDLSVDFIGSIASLPSSNKKNVSISKGSW